VNVLENKFLNISPRQRRFSPSAHVCVISHHMPWLRNGHSCCYGQSSYVRVELQMEGGGQRGRSWSLLTGHQPFAFGPFWWPLAGRVVCTYCIKENFCLGKNKAHHTQSQWKWAEVGKSGQKWAGQGGRGKRKRLWQQTDRGQRQRTWPNTCVQIHTCTLYIPLYKHCTSMYCWVYPSKQPSP